MRLNPVEGPASLFRPPSPSDSFSRYPLMHGMHQHGSQGSCPVHGHETGHHHGSPRDLPARSGRLPFEGIAPRTGPISDMRGVHSHHQRMRDEIYGINRVPLEVGRKQYFFKFRSISHAMVSVLLVEGVFIAGYNQFRIN